MGSVWPQVMPLRQRVSLSLNSLLSCTVLLLTLPCYKMAIIKFKFQVQGKEHVLPLKSCGKTFHVVSLQI